MKKVLVVVDVINGFVREGVLASDRIERIIPPVTDLIKQFSEENRQIIVFTDAHSENALEFKAFPPHCIRNTSEAEPVEEIKKYAEKYTLVEKNSTNGFHAPEFQKFLHENPETAEYIICGDCTDICVMNFAITLKTYFNEHDIDTKVTVIKNLCETYDADGHNAELMNDMAYKFMAMNGIDII